MINDDERKIIILIHLIPKLAITDELYIMFAGCVSFHFFLSSGQLYCPPFIRVSFNFSFVIKLFLIVFVIEEHTFDMSNFLNISYSVENFFGQNCTCLQYGIFENILHSRWSISISNLLCSRFNVKSTLFSSFFMLEISYSKYPNLEYSSFQKLYQNYTILKSHVFEMSH